MFDMKSYKLSFGEIIILKDNLAEVIVNEGEILNLPKVAEYHDFLHANLKAPFCLLINKKNAYSYTFKAQRVINDFSGVDKVAVLVNDAGGLMSTETLMSLNNNDHLNLKTFRVRENALSWLVVSKKEVS
jgi:hypothetical protein